MTTKLKATITLGPLILYGMGDILGAGIYGLVGKAAGLMGNAVWLGFLTSMLAAGLTGLSYASLGSRYPKAGGASYITHRAYGSSFLAYLVGLAVFASGLTSMATASRVFSGYLVGLLPALSVDAVAILFALTLAFIIFWGMRETLWMNNLLTLIELSGLVIVIAVGVSYIGSVNYLDAKTAINIDGKIALPLILNGAVLTFYSFIGFEDILNVSEEVKDPKKTVPLGLLIAVGLSSVIYMVISLIAVSVIPAGELANSKQPLVDVVAKAAPGFPIHVYSMIALFAVSNTALLNFVMGSRLLYGMAHQKLLPMFLGRVHHKRSTPHLAIGVMVLLLIVLTLVGDVSALAKATSVLILFCFTIVNVALIILQKKEKNEGGFEVPSFVPALGAVICLLMVTQANRDEYLIAGGLLAFIVVLYFIIRPKDGIVGDL